MKKEMVEVQGIYSILHSSCTALRKMEVNFFSDAISEGHITKERYNLFELRNSPRNSPVNLSNTRKIVFLVLTSPSMDHTSGVALRA